MIAFVEKQSKNKSVSAIPCVAKPERSLKMNEKKEVRNDRVEGLTARASVDSSKNIKVALQFEGKFGQGYDGCGTHTHK